MPERRFLNRPDNLGQQVADFLLQQVAGDQNSFKRSLLITPTAGAARSVNRRLKSQGFPSITNLQPMGALLSGSDHTAKPVERLLAWTEAIKRADDTALRVLFWKKHPETTSETIKASRNFVKLCDQIIEGGHSPKTLPIPPSLIGTFEEQRWQEISHLYGDYLAALSAWKLEDPNEVRLKHIHQPEGQLDRVFIAGVPDLPSAFETYIQRLEQMGTQVDLLIWNPAQRDESNFDAYGRPIPERWLERELKLSENQIQLSASSLEEADFVTNAISTPNTHLVSLDSRQNAQISSALLQQRKVPHLPEGEPLSKSEAARVATGWEEFLQSLDLRRLRVLLESPAFCRSLDSQNPLSPKQALIAIDHLLGKTIASTLEDAWAASPQLPDSADERERVTRSRIRRLLGLVRQRLDNSPLQLLRRMYSDQDNLPESAERVLAISEYLAQSPATRSFSQGRRNGSVPAQILAQALQNEPILSPAPTGAITLNGWLEAPWLQSERLVLSGATEGVLPQNIDGDPFLPDSIRPFLRLNSNSQRLARDSYLLDALSATYGEDQLKVTLSKFNSEGDPKRPSRLLFRTCLKDLPPRTLHLTKPSATNRSKPKRKTSWRWKLPSPPRVLEEISPTQFESFLACPFRFFIEKVMGYESGPKPAREMDASAFGNMIHKTLENFGLESIGDGRRMLEYTEQHIRERVQALLIEEARAHFGTNPTPAVKVQLSNASARLHSFARVQADCFAQGWKILSVERKLSPSSESSLMIGKLKLSGIIDRIEQNESTGALRIMDFKTYSNLKKPADTHLSPVSHNWLTSALIELNLGRSLRTRTWSNLQLPLYRYILEHWYPEECARYRPETAYFVLPSDPNDSGIYNFEELDESRNPDAYRSAITCAEAITTQMTHGVFWPPQPFRGSWDDPIAPLLVNGSPEDSIHPDTITQLMGGAQ